MKQLKFKGVEILTNVAGKELSDPAFAPFWKKAEELGALVMIHPNGFTHADRLTRFYFNNVIGNPLDTTIALHYLIFDGVLERHPNLKILAVHGGGYLGAYPAASTTPGARARTSHGDLPKPPTEYLKKSLFRHRGVHAEPARGAGEDIRRRSRGAGHGLSVRHGGLRSGRACGRRRGFDAADHGGDLRRQCEEDAGAVAVRSFRRNSGSRVKPPENPAARSPRSPPARCCGARRAPAPPAVCVACR